MDPKLVLAPHCSRTEKEMVGCIVSSHGAVMDEFALTQSHFYLPAPRAAFVACEKLHREKKLINVSSLESALGEEAVHEMTQGTLYRMCEFVPQSYGQTLHAILCEKLTLRRAWDLGRWLTTECQETTDIGKFCATAAQQANDLEVASESDNVLEDAVKQASERLDRMDRGEKPSRRLTPIEAWNKVFGGICDQRFYAIASRPGLGKTAMMEQMITTYLQRDECVLVFEKDMSPQLMVERIACREAGIPFWRYDREIINESERKKIRIMLSALDPNRLIIQNPNGLTAEKLCAISRREIRSHKVRAVFLDHIQCLRFPGKDLREGLTASSLAIRANVTETGVAHVVLAHINRDGAKGRPTPENIKEFDQLFGDADALAILWSEIEAADAKEDRPMKLYAAKNRGGAVVEENLSFNGPLLKFT